MARAGGMEGRGRSAKGSEGHNGAGSESPGKPGVSTEAVKAPAQDPTLSRDSACGARTSLSLSLGEQGIEPPRQMEPGMEPGGVRSAGSLLPGDFPVSQ